MKKLILTCKVLIVFFFVAKIVVLSGVMRDSESVDLLLGVDQAVADLVVTPASSPSPSLSTKDVFQDEISEERTLMAALLARQKELDERKNFLISEEKRLEELKEEILLKIEKLEETEKRLSLVLENVDKTNTDKYRSMAKVYEAAPPSRAGSMLEKLDNRTAATIIMNMKSKNAGVVLGYIDPDKSVAITREITRAISREPLPKSTAEASKE